MPINRILRAAVEKFTGGGTEKKPDRREPGEIMRKADTIGWELSAMLTSEFPERKEAEDERNEAEEALRKPIVDAKPMGRGVTSSVRVKLEGGAEGIYKPRGRETAIREGVRPGTFAMREWLAAQIDRAAGLDVVPPTGLRDGPEGMGSVQELQPGKAPIDDLQTMGTWEKTARPDALMRLGVFDRLAKQTDRSGGNFLIEEDGSLDAIDNSLIYSKSGLVNFMTKGMNIAELAYKRKRGEVKPEDRQRLLAGLERLKRSSDVMGKLREAFILALDEKDGADAWNEFADALDDIIRKKDV
jgi:hypothetical protein